MEDDPAIMTMATDEETRLKLEELIKEFELIADPIYEVIQKILDGTKLSCKEKKEMYQYDEIIELL